MPDLQFKMPFFSTEIDGFGHPSIFSPKGPGKPQKAPKGYQKALKATKRLQKAPEKPETQDLPDPQLKMLFFSTEIDGFGHASILPKGSGKPQNPPRAAKRLEKPSKGFKKLPKKSPGFARPAIKNAIFWY